MNENDKNFDLTDSILRVLGIFGFFAAVIFGFVVAGGNVITLFHPAEIIIVVGTIFSVFYAPIAQNFWPTCRRHYLPLSENRTLIASIVKYPRMPEAMPQQEEVWRLYSA